MLYNYADIIDPNDLPAKLSDLKWHITGFVDGDGSFPVVVSPVPEKRYGWLIQPRFQIELRNTTDSEIILKVIQRTMGTNATIREAESYAKLIITNRRLLLEKVIPFFTQYKPALKRDEFATMKTVAESLEAKKHMTQEGFEEIIREISTLPTDGETRRKWHYSDIVKDEQPPTAKKASRPVFPEGSNLRNYLAGFIDAEGTLGYAIAPRSRSITPYLTVTHQNTTVLIKLQQIIQCGNISTGRLQVYGIENASYKVIPFLEKHKLIARRTTYRKFKEVLKRLIEREHKTQFDQVVQTIRSLNERGILRDHTLGTYPRLEGEDMAQH